MFSFRTPIAAAAFSQFDPTSISGLVAWYDFGDTNNTTIVSGAFSAASDKSGNSHNLSQATAGLRPTVGSQNGRNTATFSSKYMAVSSSITTPSATTTFMVVGNSGGLFGLSNGSASSVVIPYWLLSDQKVYVVSTTGYTPTASAISDATPLQLTLTASNSTMTCRKNGSSQSMGSYVANVASATLDTFGKDFTYSSNGFFAEFLLYNSVLSAPQISNVESYLKSKWGTP
jgi:hypothetical protein